MSTTDGGRSAIDNLTGRTASSRVFTSHKKILWLVAIIGLAQAVSLFLPDLLRADRFAGDARQHIWWTYRFADPELFPQDFLADFFSRPLFAPYGFQVIYRVLTPWLDAQTVSEIIPILLTIPVIILAWLIGRRTAKGVALGGFIAVLFALFGLLPTLTGGFPRSFATLILLLGTWALMARRNGWLGLTFLLAAIFYPQSGINLGLLSVAVLGVRALRERQLPKDWGWLVVPGVLAVMIVGSVYLQPTPPNIGPKITVAKARTMPELSAEGRNHFFAKDLVRFLIEGPRSGLGINRYQFLAAVAGIILGSWYFRDAVPFEAWALLITSLIAFGLAHVTLFTLHLPNRYVFYTGNIFFMMCLVAFATRSWAELKRRPFLKVFATRINQPKNQTALAFLIAAGFIAGSALNCAGKLSRHTVADREAAFAFLKGLPKNTLVAAHPTDADDIPLRTQRSVIASRETALPYYSTYYQKISERLRDELAACFASDWADVDILKQKYDADVFVVNLAHYRIGKYRYGKENGFFPPFREAALQSMERGLREGFVLEHPPADRILFADGDYLVVSLKPRP